MQNEKSAKAALDKKFQKVAETAPSFDLFIAIHDFIKHIELNAEFTEALSARIKANKELNIADKYGYLKQIYQGLEDMNTKSNADLGHARYAVIRELTQIKNNGQSESNSFWKKRESSRKLTAIVYKRVEEHLNA